MPHLLGNLGGGIRGSIPIRKIGIFGALQPPIGARSTYQEEQQQIPRQDPTARIGNKSMHSGISGGSQRGIGFLMKSLDGGALFSRHALKKATNNPLD